MIDVEQSSYKVMITSADDLSSWKAVVLGLPSVAVEAESREKAIKLVAERLDKVLRRAEIVNIVPTLEINVSGLQTEKWSEDWNDFGVFRHDPEALKLFDEIEEERGKNVVEPVGT